MLVAPLVSRRPRITLEAVLAVVLAIVVGLVAARIATGSWAGSEAASGLDDTLSFPSVRLAIAAAVIGVVNGHVSQPIASTGRWLLALGTGGAVLYERATISGAVAALLTGLIAAAAVRLALGSSAGRPSLEDIAAGLEALDEPAHDLQEADRQVAGVLLVYAKDSRRRRSRDQGLRSRCL